MSAVGSHASLLTVCRGVVVRSMTALDVGSVGDVETLGVLCKAAGSLMRWSRSLGVDGPQVGCGATSLLLRACESSVAATKAWLATVKGKDARAAFAALHSSVHKVGLPFVRRPRRAIVTTSLCACVLQCVSSCMYVLAAEGDGTPGSPSLSPPDALKSPLTLSHAVAAAACSTSPSRSCSGVATDTGDIVAAAWPSLLAALRQVHRYSSVRMSRLSCRVLCMGVAVTSCSPCSVGVPLCRTDAADTSACSCVARVCKLWHDEPEHRSRSCCGCAVAAMRRAPR